MIQEEIYVGSTIGDGYKIDLYFGSEGGIRIIKTDTEIEKDYIEERGRTKIKRKRIVHVQEVYLPKDAMFSLAMTLLSKDKQNQQHVA